MTDCSCDDSCSIKDAFSECLDCILAIGENIGATIHDVCILTRNWQGAEAGEGHAVDTVAKIWPTPWIVDYAHNIRITEGGAIKQGDIILRNISKNQYPVRETISLEIDDSRVEKFYYIDNCLYTVIHIKENLLTWDIHIRKTSDHTVYLEG